MTDLNAVLVKTVIAEMLEMNHQRFAARDNAPGVTDQGTVSEVDARELLITNWRVIGNEMKL